MKKDPNSPTTYDFKFRSVFLICIETRKKSLEQNFTQKMSPLSSFKKSLKNYFSFKSRDFDWILTPTG